MTIDFLPFLPTCRNDMDALRWQYLDFLFVSGDAYVDHPSFAAALIGRWLSRNGYKVGIAAQPDWRSNSDFTGMERPRLGVLVGAGNLDSMLSGKTTGGKTRGADAYSPEAKPVCAPIGPR